MKLLDTYSGLKMECGTDEAGRGCLAGPVTAAAVILPKSFDHDFLHDSKQVSEGRRFKLRDHIESEAIAFAVAHVDQTEIDTVNILNASILAMHRSIEDMNTKPEFIIVDGNKFKPFLDVPFETIIKGDGKYKSIAAASIIAKTYRDEFMEKIHIEFPMYNWKKNKGYPTSEHRDAIKKYGITKYHRRSFRLLPDQLKLDL